MTPLDTRDLARVTLRSALLQATWNYERQQGLGWAWCLQPVLRRLYPNPAERADRLVEHTAYFNTQPTLAALALGAAARLEERRAAGGGPDAEGTARIKAALGAALAALGDRLFWGALRPLAAVAGVAVALGGSPWGAPVMWVIYNAVHLGLRATGVGWGYREGPAVLGPELRRRFERLVRLVAVAGAGMVGVAVAVALVPGGEARRMTFQLMLFAGLAAGLFTSLRARPSPTQWALGAGALCLAAAWWSA